MSDITQPFDRDLTPEQTNMLRAMMNKGTQQPEPPPVQPPPPPPPPVAISSEVVEQAPAKMPEIVRTMHHTAAQALDDAAHMLEQEMQSHIQLMRDEAERLRMQGDGQAATIEALSVLIRETHSTFKVQADKLALFRTGRTNGEPNDHQER